MARVLTLAAVLVLGPWATPTALAQTVTKIVDHGSDAQRLVFVVMGDGYASGADQTKFVGDVNALIVNGVLGHDFYSQHSTAFNVYRVDLVSQETGVSTPSRSKDTALKTIYNGDQSKCWITDSPTTAGLVLGAAASLPKVDFYVVIPNTPLYGGCTRGNILYITAGSPYTVASHEYGHGIGYLFDEYSSGHGTFSGTYHYLNCTSIESRSSIQWASKIASTTAVPTTLVAGMNDNTSLGAFDGCYYYDTGLYRPVESCRMKVVDTMHVFCPVCRDVMTANVSLYLPQEAPSSPSAPQNLRISPAAFFQTPRGNQPRPAQPTYVNLQLQIYSDGRIQVLRAAQGVGAAVAPNAIADSLYEISQNGRVFAAGPLPPGLLKNRGYARPGAPTAHSDQDAASTTLSITIPDTTLNAMLTGTSISLNQVADGVVLQKVTPAWVTDLKSRNQLKQRASIPAQTLADQLRPWLPNGTRGR